MTRPCRWPDGGCGSEIIDILTVAGRKQVLDATPQKRIVLVDREYQGMLREWGSDTAVAAVVDTYVDHHATCPKWAAKVERERATKAARP